MSEPRINPHGQPIGAPVDAWIARPQPVPVTLPGKWVRLEPLLAAQHAPALAAAYTQAPDDRDWTYLPDERPASTQAHHERIERMSRSIDVLHHAVVDQATDQAVGTLALMRIDAANGCIEVGHVNFSPRLQGRAGSTEAQYLLMQHVFETLEFRRYEWKCDALNAPSRRTALRLGFEFEGIFRQALVYKGRNRDTAWYSIIDRDWPRVRAGFERWLNGDNFDAQGVQRRSLSACRADF